jgi:hypothetical protein
MAGIPNSTIYAQAGGARVLEVENFNSEGYVNINSLTKARMTNPEVLNMVVTHLMGTAQQKFPLLYLTGGQKGGNKVQIEGIEYEWPVSGRERKTDAVAGSEYLPTDQIGLGGAIVEVVFKTSWFLIGHNIYSPSGKTCRILSKERTSTGWKYRLDIVRNSNNVTLPYSDVTPNTVWAISNSANVAESYSVGNESNWQSPGKLRNQLSIVRKSFEVAGNIANRTMVVELPTKGGGTTKYFMPHFEWKKEEEFNEGVEELLWESEYNRTASGTILNVDEATQQPIPYGAGLKQQIPNRDTYGILTVAKLNRVITDALYGAADKAEGNGIEMVIFGGQGARQDFSDAVKSDIGAWSLYDGALNNTLGGGATALTYGAYFTAYRHISGVICKFVLLPYLDFGAKAEIAPKHPISGKPMTSHSFYFVDMSRYDGQNNVQLVSQKGREHIRGIEQGMTVLPSYTGNTQDINLATNQDKSSIHMLRTCGVAIRRNTHCYSLECTLS